MLKNKFFALLLFILIIPSFLSLLRPGFFPIQDDMQVFRLFEMDKCIKDLQIPCRWIPDGGYQYGYPQFNFYTPLVYYVGEIFHLIGFQFIDSIKIVFILGFILSGFAMYILVKEFFGKLPALVASILYVYAPYKAQEVYVRGALSEFWASVFFPLILWASYKIIKEGDRKYVLFGALSLAGLFLTHNILSFLFIPILLFWVFYWLISDKCSNWKKVVTFFFFGVGISSFFLLPMIFERGYVHVDTLLGGYFDYRQHFVSIKQLFFLNNWGYGSSGLGPIDDLALSTGIVHWIMGALAVLAACFAFKKDKKISLLIIGLGVIELGILFLMHERSSFIWNHLPSLSWLQFPWRFLSLSVLVLSFLGGYLVSVLEKKRISKFFAPLLSVIFAPLLKWPNNTYKYDYKWDFLGALVIPLLFVLHLSFFAPKAWLNITDTDELTGAKWERELTASIFDYLPIYAKLPPNSKAPEAPEVLGGEALFASYSKGSDYQIGEVSVYTDATIRAPIYDFPGMTVYVDGKIVEHVNNDCRNQDFCLGLVTFDIEKGKHQVRIALEDTPIRKLGNLATLISIVGLCFVFGLKNEKLSKK